MAWQKLGQLVDGPGSVEWAATHAMLPTIHPRQDGHLDVYYSSRDAGGRSHVGRRTLDGDSIAPRADETPDLVLAPGPLGAFDDSGCQASWIVDTSDGPLMYYNGWSLGRTVPFYFYIGAARRSPSGAWTRISAAPILGRSAADPYLTASPCVLVENGRWRMWYVSGARWTMEAGAPKHYYHIRYAESRDGIAWQPTGVVCIDFASPDEYAIARPVVIRDGAVYRMWYTYRGRRYRIGYAESPDGLTWKRLDHLAGIGTGPEAWDSEMVAYPFVFDWRSRRFMIYNGNGYGRTGFGLARWE
jgi:hypothetical protein